MHITCAKAQPSEEGRVQAGGVRAPLAMMMSQRQARSIPQPTAAPFTAAITGRSKFSTAKFAGLALGLSRAVYAALRDAASVQVVVSEGDGHRTRHQNGGWVVWGARLGSAAWAPCPRPS